MNSIVNLLWWEQTISRGGSGLCLNFEVLTLFSNVAAISVLMRDTLLSTNLLAKIKEHIFQNDFTQVRWSIVCAMLINCNAV
jgi:hypothetical protein